MKMNENVVQGMGTYVTSFCADTNMKLHQTGTKLIKSWIQEAATKVVCFLLSSSFLLLHPFPYIPELLSSHPQLSLGIVTLFHVPPSS